MHDAASVVDAPRGTATAAHRCDSIAGAGPEPKAAAERRAAAAGREALANKSQAARATQRVPITI